MSAACAKGLLLLNPALGDTLAKDPDVKGEAPAPDEPVSGHLLSNVRP